MASQGDGQQGFDSLKTAEYLADKVRRELRAALMEYGAQVRSAEAASSSRKLTLLKTIAANVDNQKLSDAEFREFVRRSIGTE